MLARASSSASLSPAKLADALGDELRLDPTFERHDLRLDLSIEFAELLADAGSGELAASPLGAIVGLELLRELVEAHRAEDSLLEEAQDQALEPVLADRDALPAVVGLQGSRGSVGRRVGARVVVVALAAFPCIERLVAGRAAHHAREEVAPLPPRALGGAHPLIEDGLSGLEGLVGHDRQVGVGRNDPLFPTRADARRPRIVWPP